MAKMRVYGLSLGAGLLVGVIYSLLKSDRQRRP
jgi:xanthosine utilization system XapX-like protein